MNAPGTEGKAAKPASSTDAASVDSGSVSVLDTMSPALLVMIAIFAIQFGAALAVQLFDAIGPLGAVSTRLLFSSLLLLALIRTGRRALWRAFITHWRLLIPYGIFLCAMNVCFYVALSRIPMGAVVPLEFMGPLAVAAFNSRRPSQIAWVGLAACGIFLLSPFAGADLDPVGVAFALAGGGGWAMFIIMTKHLSEKIEGHGALAIGLVIAAVLTLPLVVPAVPVLATSPLILLGTVAVAVLSTALPFLFEFHALKRLASRVYGVLVSLEPGVAAVVGAVLLGERLGLQGIVAVCCVTIAALGISLQERSERRKAG